MVDIETVQTVAKALFGAGAVASSSYGLFRLYDRDVSSGKRTWDAGYTVNFTVSTVVLAIPAGLIGMAVGSTVAGAVMSLTEKARGRDNLVPVPFM